MSIPILEILKDINQRLISLEKMVIAESVGIERDVPILPPVIDIEQVSDKILNHTKVEIAEAKRTVTNVLTIKFESLIQKRFNELSDEITNVKKDFASLIESQPSQPSQSGDDGTDRIRAIDETKEIDLDLDIQIPSKKRHGKK